MIYLVVSTAPAPDAVAAKPSPTPPPVRVEAPTLPVPLRGQPTELNSAPPLTQLLPNLSRFLPQARTAPRRAAVPPNTANPPPPPPPAIAHETNPADDGPRIIIDMP